MTALILLEAAINQLWRGRAQNLADSVTSISSGLLMTAAGLSTRLLMVDTIFALFLDIRKRPPTRDIVYSFIVVCEADL